MREEYAGREVAFDAVRPVLDAAARSGDARLVEAAAALRDEQPLRLSWERLCTLIDGLSSAGVDLGTCQPHMDGHFKDNIGFT